MAEIRPFRGVRYNQKLVSLDAAICPPYDVIGPEQNDELLASSEYNFIRLEAAQSKSGDNEKDNKFTRTRDLLDIWLKKNVLKVENEPALYLHDHYFSFGGKHYQRRGLITTVRLEEWDKMVVRPHEGTLAEPKKERLELMRVTRAGISPIMALYEDPAKRLAALLEQVSRQQPDVNSTGGDEKHRLWVITGKSLLEKIAEGLTSEPLYIADGHHRYESALAYAREMRAQNPGAGPGADFNFVLMTLIDFDDPGLLVLPPHRLLRGLSAQTLAGLPSRLEELFTIKRLPLDESVWPKVTRLLEEGEPSQDTVVVVGLEPEQALVLKLKDPAAAKLLMPGFHSGRYPHLLVSIVDRLILESLLGLGSSHEDPNLGYFYDPAQAVGLVRSGEYQLAFLLSPVKTTVIKDVADSRVRMPRKATYFYPKLPSGLVFYKMG
ncbi:MAG: DUF1015 domain-containing protein [Dehalococcoidia bacterium]|nr:MAG: DUF1015 domain-containing protein [Dehalococcoidia bacterium]